METVIVMCVCGMHQTYSAKDTRLFAFTAQGLAVRSY